MASIHQKLGEGLDNVVHEVNGELILRRSKGTDHASRRNVTLREAELLTVVARLSTLPVPELVFSDVEAGILAYARLPGVPLKELPRVDPAHLAPILGQFVSNLHRAPVTGMQRLVEKDIDHLSAWRHGAEQDYLEIMKRVPPAAGRRLVDDFLATTPPAEPRTTVFCHNDLGSEHVLVDSETSMITGIIDWTDAAIVDPMRDFALIYRALGPEAVGLALDHYEGSFGDEDHERLAFYARCKTLEDIAFGWRTGADQYATTGLEHLTRTFR